MTMLPRFARILVVDDSPSTRKAVRAMLEEIGLVNVDEAADGAQALEMIALRRYALVVSDWFMDPMPGIELLLKLRRSERGARLPFIMMTAQNQKKFMEVARDAGATHFLAKPFTADALARKIAVLDPPQVIDASASVHFPPKGGPRVKEVAIGDYAS